MQYFLKKKMNISKHMFLIKVTIQLHTDLYYNQEACIYNII